MKTSLFDFDFPDTLIATHPASPRDSARMLVVDDALQDKTIRDLTSFLRPGDVMVFNDTRVIPARLFGKRGEAKVEILLHKRIKSSPLAGEGRVRGPQPPHPNPPPQGGREYWQCFAKPAKKLKPADRIDFADDFYAVVMEKLESGEVALQFFTTPSPCKGEGGVGVGHLLDTGKEIPSLTLAGVGDFYAKLERHGHMPLPPYIQRSDDASDQLHYQTVYAKHAGSVAAPTAGLHFTESLLAAIDALGVKRVYVTLHVGGGTFLPVKTDDTADHVMHSEYAVVTEEAAQAVNQARATGGRVIAVGTTSLRTLESAADANGLLQAFSSETAIFITPGYRFKLADMLLTNFHLPRSTLFMLVSAFGGMEHMQAAYAHAIAHQYRFYSYGDACLLMRR